MNLPYFDFFDFRKFKKWANNLIKQTTKNRIFSFSTGTSTVIIILSIFS